ncbi:MAG: hypothetical protein IJZ17_00400 [Muribaculaceae bacterium]|nr:hypothetical protein [Muribaculaceae bacterium]
MGSPIWPFSLFLNSPAEVVQKQGRGDKKDGCNNGHICKEFVSSSYGLFDFSFYPDVNSHGEAELRRLM